MSKDIELYASVQMMHLQLALFIFNYICTLKCCKGARVHGIWTFLWLDIMLFAIFTVVNNSYLNMNE